MKGKVESSRSSVNLFVMFRNLFTETYWYYASLYLVSPRLHSFFVQIINISSSSNSKYIHFKVVAALCNQKSVRHIRILTHTLTSISISSLSYTCSPSSKNSRHTFRFSRESRCVEVSEFAIIVE